MAVMLASGTAVEVMVGVAKEGEKATVALEAAATADSAFVAGTSARNRCSRSQRHSRRRRQAPRRPRRRRPGMVEGQTQLAVSPRAFAAAASSQQPAEVCAAGDGHDARLGMALVTGLRARTLVTST